MHFYQIVQHVFLQLSGIVVHTYTMINKASHFCGTIFLFPIPHSGLMLNVFHFFLSRFPDLHLSVDITAAAGSCTTDE